ncbi:isochorismatase family protein [Alicyclobacillus fastidiosus]|uniref:Isochorismatase family protein n=1 Tax=Alicyclobacillus fastidiosus TaxID=392011 RepID=A0ABY6ZKP7_9BACL|nr:isochorismatase family protein [Alicyclobacillus fastidiosus]WAH43513.1 isochorismatase family protein [Alicyclobacillus fastidiosus]GMA59675.1 hydrolase [Alicyclobacillus fastidiosus]
MRFWEEIISEQDRVVYEKAQFGHRAQWGQKPCLLIIDVIWSFIGSKPVDTLEAIDEYPTACGRVGWNAMVSIKRALGMFRDIGLPVVYVTPDRSTVQLFGATKRKTLGTRDDKEFNIPEQIAPLKGEPVVLKTRASAFFRTSLDVLLRTWGIDTVVIAGSTTSGCIRSSATDSHSSGFSTFLLEDGCFDRSQFSHCVSLFEINMKYATVIAIDELEQELNNRYAK